VAQVRTISGQNREFSRGGTSLAVSAARKHRAHPEDIMKKNTTPRDRNNKLAVKKETLKDLSANKSVVGGFIMRDTVIIRTGR
jgi:hypothetical protein